MLAIKLLLEQENIKTKNLIWIEENSLRFLNKTWKLNFDVFDLSKMLLHQKITSRIFFSISDKIFDRTRDVSR